MAKNKFNAKITEIDGIKFRSKLEAKRYVYLKELEQTGRITDLELQPKFEICPKFVRVDGKKISSRRYTADFKYKDKSGKIVIEDVKGRLTSEAKLRITLAEYLHNIKVELVYKW